MRWWPMTSLLPCVGRSALSPWYVPWKWKELSIPSTTILIHWTHPQDCFSSERPKCFAYWKEGSGNLVWSLTFPQRPFAKTKDQLRRFVQISTRSFVGRWTNTPKSDMNLTINFFYVFTSLAWRGRERHSPKRKGKSSCKIKTTIT